MRVQGTLTERDYVAAQFLHIRPRLIFAIIGLALLLLAAWAITISKSLPLIAALAFLAAWFAIIPWRARRTFREYKALSEPFSIEVRDDGLFFERANGSGLVPWGYLIKWRTNSSLVLLYPARNLFYLVPKHFFSDSEQFVQFQARLVERVGRSV